MSGNLLILTSEDRAHAKEKSELLKDVSQGVLPHIDFFFLFYALVMYCCSHTCEVTVTCHVVRLTASPQEKKEE